MPWPDAASEKKTRGALKAATDRALVKDRVVIVDSLNYIKGYRRAVMPHALCIPLPAIMIDYAACLITASMAGADMSFGA